MSDQVSREDWQQYQQATGMQFRSKPPGMVTSSIHEGTLNLPQAWKSIKSLSASSMMFTLTSPYMLAKTLHDRHYGDIKTLTNAIARVLANQVAGIDAPMVQIDEANLPGNVEDASWAHEPINLVLNAIQGERALHLCFGNYGGQSIQKGFLGTSDQVFSISLMSIILCWNLRAGDTMNWRLSMISGQISNLGLGSWTSKTMKLKVRI